MVEVEDCGLGYDDHGLVFASAEDLANAFGCDPCCDCGHVSSGCSLGSVTVTDGCHG